jgi:hypothetical protein
MFAPQCPFRNRKLHSLVLRGKPDTPMTHRSLQAVGPLDGSGDQAPSVLQGQKGFPTPPLTRHFFSMVGGGIWPGNGQTFNFHVGRSRRGIGNRKRRVLNAMPGARKQSVAPLAQHGFHRRILCTASIGGLDRSISSFTSSAKNGSWNSFPEPFSKPTNLRRPPDRPSQRHTALRRYRPAVKELCAPIGECCA